ncbi:MAG: hypothetical protein A3B23_03050 [Candidatus Colwellbacteria bacterium RIFCSPLOWO2_01_FULL_48_10]|uniref:Fibronectin type-III domain-containing protein n=2 Tax=Bacteria candidate phyla TaxID=1783234 RepID=A0A1F5P118_9BACT|nr:MAG: hypothetical protein A2846_00575 [Candidatus Doudnabacteria bacterium RIFCSPHIGHO2_01_FULL_49_9]OGY60045.1 MAG: hypothetical protein A3B23_03050 [Candidatus Colwellbacteria bacterium RIFCSPLOWO2_01_FULL_48_10]
MRNNLSRDGEISIILILGLTAAIVVVGVGALSFSSNESLISGSFGKSSRAMAYAEAGARDALARISRNRDYTAGVYTIDISSPTGSCATVLDGCASVRVDGTTSPKIITSIGTAGTATRKIQVDASYDSNGVITNKTWMEVRESPTVSTGSATGIGDASATLNGWTNTNSNSGVLVWFRYASFLPANCNDAFGTGPVPSAGISKSASADPSSFSHAIASGLSAGTKYYYCAIASYGSSEKIYGQLFSFTTTGASVPPPAIPPTAVTVSATDINDTTSVFHATLNGLANPNGTSTTAWFRYSALLTLVCSDSFGTRVPLSGGTDIGSGVAPIAYSQFANSLEANTTYYYCAIASNSAGTSFGSILTFTTPANTFPSGMAVTSDSPPFITIYKRSGDTFTKLADPATLPTYAAYGVDFSTNDDYLAVAHSNEPYITIYKRSGDTFTKLADPAVLPGSDGYGVAFSSNATYLAVGHYSSPYITIYKRSGDTFTKLANPATPLSSRVRAVAFSSNATYLALASDSPPYLTIYERSGDTFTKLADPAVLPPNNGYGVAFSSDDTYLSVGHSVSPFITIYTHSGNTFTKLADPTILPLSTVRGTVFSSNVTYLALANHSSPFITIYKRSEDTFTKLADPAVLPPNNATAVDFSVNDLYLVIANIIRSPDITIYKRSGDTFTKLADPAILPGSAFGVKFTNQPEIEP